MKKMIKALLWNFGIIAFKRSSRIYLSEFESYRIALKLCESRSPVIIDGGAHTGETVIAFRSMAPRSIFYCFEPDPKLANSLSKKFAGDPNIEIIEAALGDTPGKALFNLNASSPTNSLLTTADDLENTLQEYCRTIQQVEVSITTIDTFCEKRELYRIDIIKLDLQGYDYQALVGATSILKRTSVVIVEVLFSEIYKDCHLFADIIHLLTENGFNLFTISGLHYGARDELLWADAIFVRNTNSMELLHSK